MYNVTQIHYRSESTFELRAGFGCVRMCVDVFMSVRVAMYRLSHSNIDITIAIGIHELLFFVCVC